MSPNPAPDDNASWLRFRERIKPWIPELAAINQALEVTMAAIAWLRLMNARDQQIAVMLGWFIAQIRVHNPGLIPLVEAAADEFYQQYAPKSVPNKLAN